MASLMLIRALARSALTSSPNRPRVIGNLEHDCDPPLPAAWILQAAFELIQRKLLAARPHERLHVELGRRLALDLQAARARFGPGRQPQASHPDAPPELPGLSQGGHRHGTNGEHKKGEVKPGNSADTLLISGCYGPV
jgi:hypothetical protein